MTRKIGTPLYMAPEVLEGNEYTVIADVFSFAIMLAEIWNGCEPYCEYEGKAIWALIQSILEGRVCIITSSPRKHANTKHASSSVVCFATETDVEPKLPAKAARGHRERVVQEPAGSAQVC